MGLSRQFLNLIVYDNVFSGTRSLRCIDLRRLDLFYPDLTVLVAASDGLSSPLGSVRMRRTVIPSPTFIFKTTKSEPEGLLRDVHYWSASCVPVAGRKVFFTDTCGRSLLFDADTRQVVTMPALSSFKWKPVSVFVPSADSHGDPDPDGTLFILPVKGKQERRDLGPQSSNQFDALVYRKSSITSPTKSWLHQHLPPLPCLREPKYRNDHSRTLITSYAVLGGGSQICVSTFGAGTYCLDTVSHTWTKVGDWMLPFSGKVEYVPELNLCFGMGIDKCMHTGCLKDTHELIASDLSTLDSKPEPEVVGTCQELDQMSIRRCNRSKLVYLGSRKFCLARFISDFVVFTGVEVNPEVLGDVCSGGSEDRFLMFRHKSRVALRYGYVTHMF